MKPIGFGVDDEAMQRMMIGRVLEKAGYDVRLASSLPEALDKIRILSPQERERLRHVVSDKDMPNSDAGIALLHAMRNQKIMAPFTLRTARMTDEITNRVKAIPGDNIVLDKSQPLNLLNERVLETLSETPLGPSTPPQQAPFRISPKFSGIPIR